MTDGPLFLVRVTKLKYEWRNIQCWTCEPLYLWCSLMGEMKTKDSSRNARRAFNENAKCMREKLACGFVASEEKNKL